MCWRTSRTRPPCTSTSSIRVSPGGIRRYTPDFVVRVGDGVTYIVETKGQEDLEVERKDQSARRWCEDATALTGSEWAYLKVPEALFRSYPVRTFAQLVQLI